MHLTGWNPNSKYFNSKFEIILIFLISNFIFYLQTDASGHALDWVESMRQKEAHKKQEDAQLAKQKSAAKLAQVCLIACTLTKIHPMLNDTRQKCYFSYFLYLYMLNFNIFPKF